MNLREVQSAAARVIHVERPSDATITELKAKFRYHPHDVDGVFTVPVESTFSTYADYALLTLLLPEPESTQLSEIRVFVDAKQLLIIGDTEQHLVRSYLNTLSASADAATGQLSPAATFNAILQSFRHSWDNVTVTLTQVAPRMNSVASVIRQYGRWLQTRQSSSDVAGSVLEAHQYDILADRCRSMALIKAAPKTMLEVPRVVRTYAVASAVMVVAVIVTLSLQ